MSDDFNDDMIEEFKVEAADMFEAAENGFLNIEKGEEFLTNFNHIFRSFHSLKGAAGMFNLLDLQSHMHKLESLFEAQKSKMKFDKAQIDYFLTGIDVAKSLLDGKESEFHHLNEEEFSKISDQKSSLETSHLQKEGRPLSTNQKSPATEEHKKSSEKSASVSHKANRGLVFIVDDEEGILEILKEFIEELNFEVHTFLTADAALEAITENSPTIIISDIAMPQMDGIALVKKIRETNQQVAFIMISGSLTKNKILELIKFDVFGFIEKPFNENDIKSICEQAFNHYRLNSLLNKSVNYILYQFSDLDGYLKSQGKENIRITLKEELKNIIKIQQEINERKKSQY